MKNINVSILLGKTLKSITKHGDEKIIFETINNERFKMFHEIDCCEEVYIEDICGDLNDLLRTPLTQAEISTSSPDNCKRCSTYSFYKFATIKGSVTIRWYGSSNGYYSEEVSFQKID